MSEGCKNQILVFDVGGSHISGGVFHPDSIRVDRTHTLPVRETGSVDQFLLAFESLGKIMLPSHDAHAGVAVAIPNPFDYQGGISYMQHKYQQLYGKNLRDGRAERLECTPARVHFLNDAAAFLMGEIYQGAAIGVSRAVGITLGTGVGSAFAVDGKIVVAGRGVPAGNEIWNLPYRDGSVEDFISTRSIQRRYEQLTGMQVEVREIADLGTHRRAGLLKTSDKNWAGSCEKCVLTSLQSASSWEEAFRAPRNSSCPARKRKWTVPPFSYGFRSCSNELP